MPVNSSRRRRRRGGSTKTKTRTRNTQSANLTLVGEMVDEYRLVIMNDTELATYLHKYDVRVYY